MIVCPRCSKENQDHYKFCLGCGSELPRDAVQAPKDFSDQTPPAGIPASNLSEPPQTEEKESEAEIPDLSAKKQIELASTQVRSSVESAAIEEAQPATPGAAAEKNCHKCGGLVPIDFKFCGTCGHSMDTTAAATEASEEKSAPPAATGD